MKTGIALINYDWIYLYINKSYEQLMQMDGDNLIGKSLFNQGTEVKTNYFFNIVCRHVMYNRTPIAVDTHYKSVHQPDSWAHFRIIPVTKGILIKLNDCSID
ncbi:MAG: hypothetical protein P4L35_16725 [Ignavibacteriaceae bacterium]|nr:hypothetical protein [Ignavibacteriaceae bacterium]